MILSLRDFHKLRGGNCGGKSRVWESQVTFASWGYSNWTIFSLPFNVNYFATKGADTLNAAVHLWEITPFQIVLEFVVIYLPMFFHAIYGIYIAFTAKNNVGRFGFFRNWMFILQRVSGVITLIFIVWHV